MSVEASQKFSFKGELCQHFGHDVLYTQMRFSTLEAIFEIDYEVQRQLDFARRQEIRNFIVEAIMNGMPLYFSPFVFSARGQIEQQGDEFVLTPGSKLYILDGMHRSKALSSAINFLMSELESLERFAQHDELRKYQSYIHSLKNYPITLQIYLNLNTQQERQAFSDQNSRRREAHSGQLLKFDQRDTYNQFTRKVANALQHQLDIEMNASRIGIHSSSVTSLTTMKKCLLALFEGVVGGNQQHTKPIIQETQYKEIAQAFFEAWLQLFPKQMHNRQKYACGHSGIQIALAQTVFLLTRQHGITHLQAIERLKQLSNICTWDIDHPMFAHLYSPTKKTIERASTSTAIKKTTMQFIDALKRLEDER